MKRLAPFLLISPLLFSCSPEKSEIDREAYALLSEFAKAREAENAGLINSLCNKVESRRPLHQSDMHICKDLRQLNMLLNTFNVHTQNLNFAKDDLEPTIALYQTTVQQIKKIYETHNSITPDAITPLSLTDVYEGREALLVLMKADLINKKDLTCRQIYMKVSYDPPIIY